MWFNSKQRAEPYLGLTSSESCRDAGVPFGEPRDRCCMAVVSSCREMLGLVPQRAQPLSMVAIIKLGTPWRLPVLSRRKVGMTSSPHGPYVQGYTRATMGDTKSSEAVRPGESQKVVLSSDWSLQLDSMKPESLVIADQHAAVNTFPGLVHTARHTMGVVWTRSR